MVSSCGQGRFWSYRADAKDDLSLRWAHMAFCWFCHVAAQFITGHTNVSGFLSYSDVFRPALSQGYNPLAYKMTLLYQRWWLDFYVSPVKWICVFEHSVMTNFNCACPAIQRDQGSGFLSEGSSRLTTCMSEQRRFCRDCADAQARLNLRCSHRRYEPNSLDAVHVVTVTFEILPI